MAPLLANHMLDQKVNAFFKYSDFDILPSKNGKNKSWSTSLEFHTVKEEKYTSGWMPVRGMKGRVARPKAAYLVTL